MCGSDLWLDEDGWAAAQGAPSRRGTSRVDVHLRRRGVQPSTHVHADGNGMSTGEGREVESVFDLAAYAPPRNSKPRKIPKIRS